jgi:hypothetical protein
MHGYWTRTVARVATLGLVAIALVGCSMFPRTFGFSFPAEGNIGALPVVLTDETGLVVDADAAPIGGPQPANSEGMRLPDGIPNAIIAHWIGGACDESVAIRATGSTGVTFSVKTTRKPGGCDGIGVPRQVLIHLAPNIDPRQASVRIDD